MKFKILNQGIGAIETTMPERVKTSLEIVIDDSDGEIVKLACENSVFYARIEKGAAAIPASELRGAFDLSLVRSSGTVPLGGFVALPVGDEIELYHNGADAAKRLDRVEREISDAVAIHRDILEKYEKLENRISRLFDGYNF